MRRLTGGGSVNDDVESPGMRQPLTAGQQDSFPSTPVAAAGIDAGISFLEGHPFASDATGEVAGASAFSGGGGVFGGCVSAFSGAGASGDDELLAPQLPPTGQALSSRLISSRMGSLRVPSAAGGGSGGGGAAFTLVAPPPAGPSSPKVHASLKRLKRKTQQVRLHPHCLRGGVEGGSPQCSGGGEGALNV